MDPRESIFTSGFGPPKKSDHTLLSYSWSRKRIKEKMINVNTNISWTLKRGNRKGTPQCKPNIACMPNAKFIFFSTSRSNVFQTRIKRHFCCPEPKVQNQTYNCLFLKEKFTPEWPFIFFTLIKSLYKSMLFTKISASNER